MIKKLLFKNIKAGKHREKDEEYFRCICRYVPAAKRWHYENLRTPITNNNPTLQLTKHVTPSYKHRGTSSPLIGCDRPKRSSATIWKVDRAPLTACAFSPADGATAVTLALTGRDGYLLIVDFLQERTLLAFRSYFGAFLCVAWSPDGKYVATGGEDDLVSIFSPSEGRLVARLEGHTSWVSAVAWDASLSQPGRYCVGSAEQDAKLLLWDFSLDVLHHPRRSAMRVRSYQNGGRTGRVPGHGMPILLAVPATAKVPVVEPVVAHVAHGENEVQRSRVSLRLLARNAVHRMVSFVYRIPPNLHPHVRR